MIREDFGQKLDKLLATKGMTQEQLGSAVGRTKQAVSSWITGKSYPGRRMLKKIASVLNVSEDTLVVDESGILDKRTLEAAVRVVRAILREIPLELDDSTCAEMIYHAYLWLAAYTDNQNTQAQLVDFLKLMLVQRPLSSDGHENKQSNKV